MEYYINIFSAKFVIIAATISDEVVSAVVIN